MKLGENEEYKIELLDISKRSYNCLKKNKVNYISHLIKLDDYEIRNMKNIGDKSFNEIKKVINIIYTKGIEEVLCKRDCINENQTVLEVLQNSEKTIREVYFCDEYNNFCEDILLNDMNLSYRTSNVLQKNGYYYVSELLNIKVSTLKNYKNMGEKSFNELLKKIGLVVQFKYNNDRSCEVKRKLIKIFIDDYNKSKVHFNKWEMNSVMDNVLKNYSSDIEKEEDIRKIYNKKYFINLIKNYCVRLISNEGLIEYSLIEKGLPNHLQKTEIFKNIFNSLIKDTKIVKVDTKYRIFYPYLQKAIEQIKNEKLRTIIIRRINQETFECIGNSFGLSRERIRQIEKKGKKEFPHVAEDDYAILFKKYNWSSELFCYVFNQSNCVYNYLVWRYGVGEQIIENILHDDNINLDLKKRAKKIIYKSYLFIDNVRVKKDRQHILNYLIRTYCEDEVHINDVEDLYNMFLEDYNLTDEKYYYSSGRYLETRLIASDIVLWKYGRRLRYYDTTEINEENLAEDLEFDKYSNIELSTLKLFKDYEKIMNEWDIRDEYELHNLIKKVVPQNNIYKLKMLKMPTIRFGQADREMQVFNLLLENSPISNVELANNYERKYGIKDKTVLANYFKCIEEYCYKGVYSIEYISMKDEQVISMKNNLTQNTYSIDELINVFKSMFPKEYKNYINEYNMKKIGFRMGSRIAYPQKYNSLEKYCYYLLMKDDVFDIDKFHKNLTITQEFYNCLAKLKQELDIIEFYPKKYINIRKLASKNINKNNLYDIVNAIDEFVGNSYFTIYSLRRNGFTHEIDNLGFEDYFFNSILICNQRFKSCRVSGRVLFKKCCEKVTVADLVASIVYKKNSIDVFELIDFIDDEYGIEFERYKISLIADAKGLYYDEIMEKIYINYDEYFKEV